MLKIIGAKNNKSNKTPSLVLKLTILKYNNTKITIVKNRIL